MWPVAVLLTVTGRPYSALNVSEPGDFLIFHDGTSRRAWVSLQLLTFLTLIILALPARRRRSQMSEQELA